MISEYIPLTSKVERKTIIKLAEQGPMSGYDFHLGGKRQRAGRKALMSSSYWIKVLEHIGSEGLDLIKRVKKRRSPSHDERGRRKDLYWLTDKGIIYALDLDVNLKLLLENIKKVYPKAGLLRVIVRLKQVLGEKAFNYVFGEAVKLEDFSEQSLQRLVSTVVTYGFMKARELSPQRDPYLLKRQIESVVKEWPEVYELYKAFKSRTKRDLDVLFSS